MLFLHRIYHPEEVNILPGYKLLYRIMQYITEPPDQSRQTHFALICKAVLHAYNPRDRTLSEDVLRMFFNQNGYPLSLSDEAVSFDHKRWDSIEKLNIVIEKPNRRLRIVVFERFEGGRRIAYGRVRS
ncbi:uncharacterized protein LOC135126378 [Zophobas morio]|uniref:uncharacterized protein LOC135126378 n=1 Tax=Zophobas morio TaxID=2755281 RepID=UPI0030830B7B